jgi:hypothetical protein
VAADGSHFGWSVTGITVGGVIVCGLAGPSAGAAPAAPLAWLLFVGSSVHVAATLGLFSFAEVREHARRHPPRYLLAPGALLASTVALCLSLTGNAKALGLLGFFAWQLWHYQKQNLGLVSLAFASSRLPSLRRGERRCILASGIAGVLALVANPSALQIVDWRPAASITATAHSLAVLVIGASIAAATVVTGRRWATATTTAQTAAVYLVAVSFPLPLLLTRSPYAAIGGLTLAHGLQYLWLVGNVVSGPPSACRRPVEVARLITLATVIVAAAGVLAALSHLHADARFLGKMLFGAYLAVVMTHFVVDAGLWRLGEEFPRRWLSRRLPQLLVTHTG